MKRKRVETPGEMHTWGGIKKKKRAQRGSVVALNVSMVVMPSQADHRQQSYTGCLPVNRKRQSR